ncbi:beta-lactamase family protein [Sphingomonas sp. NSE70-1]|uniref:Beta-lactamase family protein n=1 Tax=Sphingomonas caseinilyticus TaxID=2908205 RepID=A0ABT0RSG1_9SPHN|nr:serine hydrolase domain-containing protein [Sphingomonas caseinilyticus]MCL6697947.1 beta-lactamase family protein [Sphingomonas caseinilyticus]
MMRPAFALLALLTCTSPAYAQAISPAEQARIDKLVTETLDKTKTPSASVAIVRGGQLVLAKAYGKAAETIPAATPALPYQIASNSKQFTAMALLLLEDEGKLYLDDKVSKYLPGISGGDRIALRQLLNHTSGLQDYWPQDYSFPAMARPTTPQQILDVWAKKPLDYAPGTKWQYSNTGYVVAGMIVEKVAGEPLFSFLQKRIFQPLGMTSVVDMDKAIGPNFPQGYGRAALGPVRVETPAAPGWLYAAGELSMTPTDLAKWDIARMNRAYIPADDWDEQERTVRLADGEDSNYGLGVRNTVRDGRRVISHSGESAGFLSLNSVYPESKSAIIVMTNTWSSGAYSQISRGLAEIILPPTSADPVPAAQAATVRTVYNQLRSGMLDRKLLTANANYYFTPTVAADVRSSLSPLGAPVSIEPDGSSTLRGGFVIQGYTVKYPNRTLDLSVFMEPGANGRVEQFLVRGE